MLCQIQLFHIFTTRSFQAIQPFFQSLFSWPHFNIILPNIQSRFSYLIILLGFIINYVGPLTLVISISILKELYDDILRHKRDQQLNNELYESKA